MSKGLLFWIIYLVCAIVCIVLNRAAWPTWLALFVLIGVLGWAVFGAMVK